MYLFLLHQRQRLRPARQPAPYRDSFGSKSKEDEADNDDAPHFREIPEKESSDYEVSVNFLPNYLPTYLPTCLVPTYFDSLQTIGKRGNDYFFIFIQAIKPFVAFGKENTGLGESSMKGVNFYQQYGQHDDRQEDQAKAKRHKD